ncbi:MAG: hypothetical protein JXR97_01785, partial [Planctomycetes bacterium]|nr:hypothetical protein [Planctomycetota bacterium]
MKFEPCRACGAYLSESDKHCFNCGKGEPREKDGKVKRAIGSGLAAALGAATGAGVGVLLPFPATVALAVVATVIIGRAAFGKTEGINVLSGLLLLAACGSLASIEYSSFHDGLMGIIGAILGGYAGAEYFGDKTETLLETESSTSCLNDTEEIVKTRIYELREQASKISKLMNDMGESDGTKWSRAGKSLQVAYEANQNALGRWWAKMWRITMIRWQNNIEPLACGINRIGSNEALDRLNTLRNLTGIGRRMLIEWRDIASDDLPEVNDCFARMENALAAANELEEQLMLRQATSMASEIAPARDEAERRSLSSAALQRLGYLQARVSANNIFSEVEVLG